MTPRLHIVALAVFALAGCSGPRKLPGDDQPILASLSKRTISVPQDGGIAVAEEQTIAAYRAFLAAAPNAPQRPEAMRRLGDLEMDRADRVAADGAGSDPDYKTAVARYDEFLKRYPNDPRNDRVLYQLARAQEQAGQLEAALQTLTRLVAAHPGTQHAGEAHFRRGELLFTLRAYKQAEAAYATVLAGDTRGAFDERALYMHGWSLYKQGRIEESLQPFFAVLDLKLRGLDAAARDEADLAALPQLKRADRELVDDSFRVISIALAGLQGADSVAACITTPLREGYQFRVYQQLGELYIKQDRIKDAADTFALFVKRQPLHAQAPLLQARVIEIYERNGFELLALQAKKDHVQRYGADSEFRRANPAGWRNAQPLVKTHLIELARHHHALAQKSKASGDVQEAVRWYRALLATFPTDSSAGANRFLLAELLFEDRRWADAAVEYETVAYGAATAQSADAGYAALLAYAAQEQDAADNAQRAALQRQAVASALRFAAAFPADTRSGAVLTRSAEQLYALGDSEQAHAMARQALALTPPPAAALRRTAWTVVAHHAFETAQFIKAERAYGEVLALTTERSAGRDQLVERQAAAIYKQGEIARTGGDARGAVGHFARIAGLGDLPANSAVRASAQYDAAAALIGLKDWDAAARALEGFRRQQPANALQSEVAPKLALAYLELGRSTQAAAEFERVAAQTSDPAFARAALWQAADLHQKASAGAPPKSPLLAAAIKAYERVLAQQPQATETAVEARWRLALLTRQDGQPARATTWLKDVQAADAAAGDARTARTRTLAGQAALLLAEPVLAAYKQVPLVEPLAKQLKAKKAKMEDVLRAYAAAAEVQVADVTTAATFHTAAIYQDFGRALIGSQRPKKLNKAEIEQYTMMLEEQAFPFEEKAIALHETNARRSTQGIYDAWVQASFTELAKIKPVRYAKVERSDAQLPGDIVAIEAALQSRPNQPQFLNQLGVLQRRQGRFDKAREAYDAAIAADPAAAAPLLNLAILNDLYLGDNARALLLYQRVLELLPGIAAADVSTLGKWVAELKTRKPLPNTAAAPASENAATVASRRETH